VDRLHHYMAIAALVALLATALALLPPPRRESRNACLRAAEAACRLYMDRYAPPR